MGYALWLVPSEADTAKLRTIMDLHPSPRFQPHITIASLPWGPPADLQSILPKLSSILHAQPPLFVTFDAVEVGDHFFRSVYILVRASDDLLALHRAIHIKLLGLLGLANIDKPKFPHHLSLCYISREDAKAGARTKYLEQLQSSGKLRSDGPSVSLNCRERDDIEDDWLSGFQAAEIWLVDCTGPANTWTPQSRIAF